MRIRRALLLLLLVPVVASAQDSDQQLRMLLQGSVDDIAGVAPNLNAPNSQGRILAVDRFLRRPSLVAAAAQTGDLQFIIEASRIDKQVGSSGGSSGSTNLVTSGSVPRILGFAVENGALTQTVSGTTITFRTNPAGLVEALQAKGLVAAQPDVATQHTLDFLERINVGLTFDTSRETDQRFTGSYRQLQEASTQIYLYNRRDPTHPKWQPVWDEFRRTVAAPGAPGTQLANAINVFGASLQNSVGYTELQAISRQELIAAPTASEIAELVLDYVKKASKLASNATQARTVTELWTAYLRQQRTLYDSIARSPILTLEYVLTRSPIENLPSGSGLTPPLPTLPDLSVTRLVFVRPFIGSSDMTLNASLSFFNNTLPSLRGNIRDWQVGGKLDFPLPEITGRSKGQLTFSGLFMRLRQKPLGVMLQINGKNVADKGDIGLFQARVRFPLGDSGFSVPLSVTYASRTELIDEKDVRGNIGLTFDLDKLFAFQSR